MKIQKTNFIFFWEGGGGGGGGGGWSSWVGSGWDQNVNEELNSNFFFFFLGGGGGGVVELGGIRVDVNEELN